MAARLKIYVPPEEQPTTMQEPTVRVRLGDLLPLIAVAQRMNFIWLRDFLDDEVVISQDLHDVIQTIRRGRPTSA